MIHAVLVRTAPGPDGRAAEALRMAVGLTLRGAQVRVFFLDEGVHALTAPSRHLTTLHALGHALVVDEDALCRRGLSLAHPARRARRGDLAAALAACDTILSWGAP